MSDRGSISEDEKKLWDYYINHDFYSFQEFATAIVGIGALLFAFATTIGAHPSTRIVIALIGLSASLILFWDMKSTSEDKYKFQDFMRNRESTLLKQFEEFRAWRHIGRHWYSLDFFPPSKASRAFMLLVANVWVFLLLANLPQYFVETNFIPPLSTFIVSHGSFTNPWLYSLFLLISFAILVEAIVWRWEDLKKRRETKTYLEIGLSGEQLSKVQRVMQLKGLGKRDEAVLHLIDAFDLKQKEN